MSVDRIPLMFGDSGEPPTWTDIFDLFIQLLRELSWVQIFLLVASAALWITAANAVRRMNMKRPGTDGNDFNAKEWSVLAISAAVALSLAAFAISLA